MKEKKKEYNGQPKVILVEGLDYKIFLLHLIGDKFPATKEEDIFIEFYAGHSKLEPKLTELETALEDFAKMRGDTQNNLEYLLIICDAEDRELKSAEDSIKFALKNKFAIPEENGKFTEDADPNVGYFIVSNGTNGGNLEELCLASVHDESTLKKANAFVEESKKLFEIKTPHKSRLAAYLAIARKFDKNKGKLDEHGGEFATLKLGEAANAGAFNFDNQAMEGLLAVLENFLALPVG